MHHGRLTTSGGSTAALKLTNAAGVTLAPGGTDNVRATGGPAVDVTGTPGIVMELDDVDSTNSAGDGINLDGLGGGTFSAASGDIGGYTGVGFDLHGGSGSISYAGNLNDAPATTAVEVTGRTGGSAVFSGPIADSGDAGGTIVVGKNVAGETNSGGSTTFSGSSKVLNTGASNAVSFVNSDGHTLSFTGGGLDVDTTSGQGVLATSSGTINVNGANNTVQTANARAVNLENTDIGSSGFFLRSVGTTGGAPNGIRLDHTGDIAGMTITGDGTNNSGGTINDTTEHGVSLAHTRAFNADELSITNTNHAGVDGTEVTNFTFTDGQILNAGDARVNNLHGSIAFNDQATANENNLDGVVTITGNLLKDHYGGGVDVFNHAGTISDATISNNTIDSLADLNNSREDAISFNLFSNASTAAA